MDPWHRWPPWDLLRLRRKDPVFAAQAAHGIDGAVLGPEAFLLRFFAPDGDDRLLLVNFGRDLVKPSLATIKDLTFREGITLAPLVILTILFGVYPKPVLDISAASVQLLVNNYATATSAIKAASLLQ